MYDYDFDNYDHDAESQPSAKELKQEWLFEVAPWLTAEQLDWIEAHSYFPGWEADHSALEMFVNNYVLTTLQAKDIPCKMTFNGVTLSAWFNPKTRDILLGDERGRASWEGSGMVKLMFGDVAEKQPRQPKQPWGGYYNRAKPAAYHCFTVRVLTGTAINPMPQDIRKTIQFRPR